MKSRVELHTGYFAMRPQPQAKVDEKWLRLQIGRKGYSLRAFATKIGLDPSQMLRTFKGKRGVHMAEMEAIARELGVAPGEVFARFGVRLTDAHVNAKVVSVPPAPVMGTVNAKGEVAFSSTDAEPDADVLALAIVGDPFMAGAVVMYRPEDVSQAPTEGQQVAIVQLRDGRMLLRKIQPGFTPGRFNLGPAFGYGDAENDADVVGVIPVAGIRV